MSYSSAAESNGYRSVERSKDDSSSSDDERRGGEEIAESWTAIYLADFTVGDLLLVMFGVKVGR